VVLRYFNAYGPRQRPDMAFPRVVEALLAGRPFTLFGDGEQSRSFTFVRDVVEASVLAMERAEPGTTYNVGGGQEATMNEALAALEEIAGRRLDVRREPAVPGDQRRTKADTARIREELGWSPRTPLEEGLRAQWEWAQGGAAVESPL
jgi:nucleoside-diphosphate-sugar epimerase